MARAIEERGSLRVGYAELGMHGDKQGSVKQQVHDGDTLAVKAAGRELADEIGNFAVRFLGVDAPEISFPLPDDKRRFVSLGDDKWADYLENPFREPFEPPLSPRLLEYLKGFVGPGAAENHFRHAEAARDALEGEVLKDVKALDPEGLDPKGENFRFLLVFAYEVMDPNGRFLCYINRYQPDKDKPTPRPRSYNERLLETGKVNPYFIWPNVDPFRKAKSVVAAVPPPGTAATLASVSNTVAGDSNALAEAREAVRNARERGLGIFDAQDPLRLQPFEVRFLGRQKPPDRWVIDLSKGDDILIQPQEYWTVPNPEDRLFVPEEYVPLFVEKGWRRQAFPADGLTTLVSNP